MIVRYTIEVQVESAHDLAIFEDNIGDALAQSCTKTRRGGWYGWSRRSNAYRSLDNITIFKGAPNAPPG